MFGNFFGCDSRGGGGEGATGIWLVNAGDAVEKHPAVHRVGPHNERLSGSECRLCW